MKVRHLSHQKLNSSIVCAHADQVLQRTRALPHARTVYKLHAQHNAGVQVVVVESGLYLLFNQISNLVRRLLRVAHSLLHGRIGRLL